MIQPMGRARIDNRPVTLVGYPLDKQLSGGRAWANRFEQWISTGSGRIRAYAKYVDDTFFAASSRKAVLPYKSGRMITYDACSMLGNSGSPVWVITPQSQRNLIAVHTTGISAAPGEPYDFGAGVLLSSSVLATLHNWQRLM